MLTLLLDEQIAPTVAEQIKAKDRTVRIESIHQWHGGEFLNTDDDVILEVAFRESASLVTFDQSTIRPVLREWGEQGRSHGGVIFIDNRTIASNNYGGLVTALLELWNRMQGYDFTDVALFLQPSRR